MNEVIFGQTFFADQPISPEQEVVVLEQLVSLGYTQEAHSILSHYVRDRIQGRLDYIKMIQKFRQDTGNEDQAKRERWVLHAWQACEFTDPEMWPILARIAANVIYPFRVVRRV